MPFYQQKLTVLIFGLLCLTTVSAEHALNIEVEPTHTPVRIYQLNLLSEDNGHQLTGKIKQRNKQTNLPQGEIAYVVKNFQGILLHHGRVNYSPSLSLQRWKHGSRFEIQLPNNLPENSLIRVGWKRK